MSDIEQTRLIRRQQDEAYEESLRADRDKVKRKREVETREQEEAVRVKQFKDKCRNKLAHIDRLYPTTSETVKLVVKFPNGNRNEDCPQNFEISTNFPAKVIKCDEKTSTSFQEIGITQSTVLFVIDKDA